MASRAALCAALVMLTPLLSSASGRYDPRLRFHTISTPRTSTSTFTRARRRWPRGSPARREVAAAARGGHSAGRRVACASSSWTRATCPTGGQRPLPYDRSRFRRRRRARRSTIGNTDDWLRLVFSHEYTHIVHLDRGARLDSAACVTRSARLPLLFPNLFLPQWQIEGLATYEESALTDAGRVPDGDFRAMLLDRAAAADGSCRSTARAAD